MITLPASDTFFGAVLVPCLGTTLNGSLFRVVSVVVGSYGVFAASALLIATYLITVLSMSSFVAIITNGNIIRGNLFVRIRNSVGMHFSALIGLALYFCYVSSVSAGAWNFSIVFSSSSWICVIGSSVLIALNTLLSCSTYGAKLGRWMISLGCFLVVLCGLITFACFLTSQIGAIEGYVGFSLSNLEENLYSRSDKIVGYQDVIPLFFTPFIGVLAGVHLTSEVKYARINVPRGVFWSLSITLLMYLLMVLLSACTVTSHTFLAAILRLLINFVAKFSKFLRYN